MIHKISLALLAGFLIATALWGKHMHQAVMRQDRSPKLDQIVSVSNEPLLDCAQISAQHPLVILALGQSNTGNHGERTIPNHAPVLLFADSKCVMATDPLPGSTGGGGSIWSRLPNSLPPQYLQRPLVLSIMGVDATSIADWTDKQSPLRQRLMHHIKSMDALGLSPTVVLWQQGEADAQLGTSVAAYHAGLDRLASDITQSGSHAPIVLAQSTVCRSAPNANIRTAITMQATQNKRFKLGPDTDTLNNATLRMDGCHFSAVGLDQAAQLWADELQLVFASI
jgi:hypothetical protein